MPQAVSCSRKTSAVPLEPATRVRTPAKLAAGSCVPSSSSNKIGGFAKSTVNQNVDPSPGLLSTPIWPPMSSTNCLEIASPSPVPPYLRVMEPSACTKGWKSPRTASSPMPMPVSDTCTQICASRGVSWSLAT